MEINNIDALVDFVLKVPKMHRIHLIYTKENNYVEKLREKFSKLENVAFVPLLKEKDIEYLVIGELTKSVY
jgi:acetolactate synthase small subunit